MPRNFPPHPDYSGSGGHSEEQVWRALQGLPDDAVVFARYPVRDNKGVLREADFVVAVPHVGMVVIEVKGGLVWSQANEWFSQDRLGQVHEIHNPLGQARTAGYALRDYAAGQGLDWPAWTAMAVLTGTPSGRRVRTADSTSEQWVFADEVAELPARLFRALSTSHIAAVTAAQVDLVVDLLEHRLPRPPESDLARAELVRADMVTRDQYAILKALRGNDRIVVSGGPGTGKTWLAMEHARAETGRGARVAVVCFNRALATALQQVADTWPAQERPAVIGSLHHLALQVLGERVPEPVPEGYWDVLPGRAAQAASGLDEDQRFDLVIVDEGQDLDAAWWPAVTGLLRDPDDGLLVVFLDEDQSLYEREPIPVAGVSVTLTENVRNTAEIAAAVAVLTDDDARCRRGSGPCPEFFDVPAEAVVETADAVVAALLESGGWHEGDIAVLTTWRRHPGHARRMAEEGWARYTESLLSADSVAYSTVKSFKGLERPVVVLAVDGFHPDDPAADLLRVGLSRPTHRLIVVAPRCLLEQIGGDELVRAVSGG